MKSFFNRKMIILAAMLLAGLVGITWSLSSSNGHERVIFTINGEPITCDEFKMQSNMERANVISYFQNKYSAIISEDFWTTDFSGEIPAERLKKTVVEKLVRVYSIKRLALEYKIISDIGYEKFLSDMKKENERRAKAIKDNQPVYGPKQFGLEAYYSYYISNMELAVKNKMKAEYKELLDRKIRYAKIVIDKNEYSGFTID